MIDKKKAMAQSARARPRDTLRDRNFNEEQNVG